MTLTRTGLRRCGSGRWASCQRRSLLLMPQRAEGGLPSVEAVVKPLDAFAPGPWVQGLADFEHPVHAGRVPGAGELVQGLLGVLAGSFGGPLGGFDGREVAEDDGALLVVCRRGGLQCAGKSCPRLGM